MVACGCACSDGACRQPPGLPPVQLLEVWDRALSRSSPPVDLHLGYPTVLEFSGSGKSGGVWQEAATAMAPHPLADQLDLIIPTIRDLEFLEQWCGRARRAGKGWEALPLRRGLSRLLEVIYIAL